MGHGILRGVKHQFISGVKHGVLPLSGGITGVTQDSASLKFAPANDAEWTTFMSAIGLGTGNPTQIWNCQDLSGNLVAAKGTNLTVAGAPTYNNAVAGWNRKSFNITATTVQAASQGVGVGPDPSTTSVLWLAYVATTTTPGGGRDIITVSNNATGCRVMHLAGNNHQMVDGANTANSVNSYTRANPYVLALKYDKTNAVTAAYTDLETWSVPFTTVVDGAKGIGAVTANGDAGSKYLYLVEFSGAAAELTTAQLRTLITGLNWSVPW